MKRRNFLGTTIGSLLGAALHLPGKASPLGPISSTTEVVVNASGGHYLYRDVHLPVRFNRTQPGFWKRLFGAKEEVEHIHPYMRNGDIIQPNPDYETAEFELCVSRADAMVGDYEPVVVRREAGSTDVRPFEEVVCERIRGIM